VLPLSRFHLLRARGKYSAGETQRDRNRWLITTEESPSATAAATAAISGRVVNVRTEREKEREREREIYSDWVGKG